MTTERRDDAILDTRGGLSHSRSFSIDRLTLYLIFISYFLYQLQGTLYTSGGLLSQSLLFLIIAVDLIYFSRSLLFQKPSTFYYLWTSFFLLNVLGFFFWGGSLSNPYHFSMFKGIMLSLATFYSTYCMARKGEISREDLLRFFLLQLGASIVSFFYNSAMAVKNFDLEEDNIVNNVAYEFVFLIPFLFLITRRQSLGYIALFVLLFFIVQGAKRGAIIVGGALVLLYLCHSFTQAKHQKGAYKRVLLVWLGIIAMGYASYRFVSSDNFLLARFESMIEGNTSGRTYLYTSIWNSWWNDTNDWTHFFFGYGFAGSQQLTDGRFAHNDWLEALSNFGLVGVMLYFSLIITGFSYALNSGWTNNREDRMLLLSIMTAWFLTSLFSMWYTSIDIFTQPLLLGYLIGKNNKTLLIAH